MSKETMSLKTFLSSLAVLAATIGAAVWAAPAEASAPIVDFEIVVTETQAGAHPDLITRLEVENTEVQNLPAPTASARTRKT